MSEQTLRELPKVWREATVGIGNYARMRPLTEVEKQIARACADELEAALIGVSSALQEERHKALEEAAVAMCSYCQGKTFQPKEVRLKIFTVANDGYDSTLYWHGDDSTGTQCQASAIRRLAARETGR